MTLYVTYMSINSLMVMQNAHDDSISSTNLCRQVLERHRVCDLDWRLAIVGGGGIAEKGGKSARNTIIR
ncbi:1377_t:CDS:1, partial [Acaulospora colombiana]